MSKNANTQHDIGQVLEFRPRSEQRTIDQQNEVISLKQLHKNNSKFVAGLIAPAREEVKCEIVAEHTSEPIKSMEHIALISEYLIEHERYRDNMLFVVGINFGLRVSDLRVLRFSNLITPEFMFKDRFPVFEKKTRNTRKKKMNRYITINTAVIEAVTLFLDHTPGVCLSDYMFRSVSNNGSNKNEPISARSIDRILKGINKDLGLGLKISTHTLRKTFCYHQMLMSHNDSRKLLLLQKMLNHSSPAQTLDYIGITDEEIEQAYKELNLGSKTANYLINSSIGEAESRVQ